MSLPLSRRRFLRAGACAALGSTGLVSALAQLRSIAAGVAAAGEASDYKALVCVFLYGGNDANNLLVPRDETAYGAYARSRSILALPREDLLALPSGTGGAYAFHPAATGLRDLYAEGRLAVLANVGTLVAPVTKKEYLNGSAALPSQLFSHNDQSMQWQAALADTSRRSGWGGRVADLLQALNANQEVSMSISLAGTNTWQVGRETVQYQVTDKGPVAINAVSASWADAYRKGAFKDLMDLERRNLLEDAIAGATRRTVLNDRLLSGALSLVPTPTAPFDKDGLGPQLRMIARLAKAGPSLGFRRQIFFASLGGWDTHDTQLTPHAGLLGGLSRSFVAFQKALVEFGIADSVTLFTASDFGRTFTTNGKGSDHGWGSHHLILGGAVRGGQIYGRMPELAVGGPDDAGQGRWIPTTSVDQYSAALARWFGASSTDLPTVFPNLPRFEAAPLGFLV